MLPVFLVIMLLPGFTPLRGQGGAESGGRESSVGELAEPDSAAASPESWEQDFQNEFQLRLQQSAIPGEVAEMVQERMMSGPGVMRDLQGLAPDRAAELAMEQTRRVDDALRRGAQPNQAAVAAVRELRRESRRRASQAGGSEASDKQDAAERADAASGQGGPPAGNPSGGMRFGSPGGVGESPLLREGPGRPLNRALEQIEKRRGPRPSGRVPSAGQAADSAGQSASPGQSAPPPGAAEEARNGTDPPVGSSPDRPSDSPSDSPDSPDSPDFPGRTNTSGGTSHHSLLQRS